jgi:hypothetical protein
LVLRHGRSRRYRDYCCYSVHNFGRDACDAERLPADELDDAIMKQLVSVLEQEPLVGQAITEAFAEIESDRSRREHDVVQLDGEIRRTKDARHQHFLAFEEGTLEPEDCAPRIKELQAQKQGLEARREELSLDDYRHRSHPRPRSTRAWCTRSGWSAGTRSILSSRPRFDLHPVQWPREESNLRTRIRSPLL